MQSTKDVVVQALAGLAGRERTLAVKTWALELNVDPSTIYRWLGPTPGRMRRADKGKRIVAPDAPVLDKIVAVSVRYGMTAEMALEHAEASGWIAPGTLSPATYNRILAERGVSLRDLGRPGRMDGKLLRNRLKNIPHRSWEAEKSNMIHQLDITEMPRYFVEPDGSIGFESVLTFGPNKRGNLKPHLHLFTLVDDHSRATFARFYFSKNVLNWIDFCVRAWDTKDDPARFPFSGRPEVLYGDNDSAPKSDMFSKFIADMEVEFKPHEVGNSPAKGKVERRIGDLKAKMEVMLRIRIDQGKPVSLTDANALLDDLLYRVNNRKHGTTREVPIMRWRAGIQGRPVRMLPPAEVLERYYYDVRMRPIYGNLTVRLGGYSWQLPRKEPFISFIGRTVPVYFHRGEVELKRLLVVLDDREYVIEAKIAQPDASGQIKSLPKGDREKLLEALYAEDIQDLKAGGFYKDRYATLFVPAQEEAFDASKVEVPRRIITRVDLKLRLVNDGIDFDPEAIDALFTDGKEVDESDYERIVEQCRAQGHRRHA